MDIYLQSWAVPERKLLEHLLPGNEDNRHIEKAPAYFRICFDRLLDRLICSGKHRSPWVSNCQPLSLSSTTHWRCCLLVVDMSWFFVIVAFVHAAWTRLLGAVASLTRSQKPYTAAALVPVSAAILKAEDGSSETVGASDECQRSPALQETRQTVEMKRGSQTARALFRNSFNSPSPMGVFEITSNAFSPKTPDVSISIDTSFSPSENGAGTSQCTALFEGDLSNSSSDPSTAPTSPASAQFSPPMPKSIAPSEVWGEDNADEEDIPLSTLAARRITGGSKRYGLAGDLVTKKFDQPVWISRLRSKCTRASAVPAPTSTASLCFNESKISDANVKRRSSSFLSTYTPTLLAHNRPKSSRGWWETQDQGGLILSDDDSVFSVYSLDSCNRPSRRTSRNVGRRESVVPEITLTPPSLPTSPDVVTSGETSGKALFLGHQLPVLNVGPALLLNYGEGESPFKPTHLMVPSLEYGYTGSLPIPDLPVDLSTIKRQRRNAHRMTTSSIDLLMAGLDQVFPDSPKPLPPLPSRGSSRASCHQPGDVEDVASSDSASSFENEAAVREHRLSISTRLFVSPSQIEADNSLTTFYPDESMESRFSDSSDEEDEFYKPQPSRSFKDLSAFNRTSWPMPRTPLFDPSSVLTTIMEEEEGSDSREELTRSTSSGKTGSRIRLEPSAIIDADGIPPSKASADHIPASSSVARRCCSMIESLSSDLSSTESGNAPSEKGQSEKRLSAPSLSVVKPVLLDFNPVARKVLFSPGMGSDFVDYASQEQLRSSLSPLILPSTMVDDVKLLADTSIVAPAPIRISLQGPWLNGDSLSWPLYQCPQEFGGLASSGGCSSSSTSRRSSVSSLYSEMVDVPPVSPLTPDTFPEEEAGRPDSPQADPDCPIVLNTVASNPQGLSGILAILDRLELENSIMSSGEGNVGYRPISALSRFSSELWRGSWESHVEAFYAYGGEELGGPIAV
ncbi:hypothetical protein BKA70DRAFT_1562068 [Coprinopsis sp. MPI-PUGE-AT-0042]|nr:hypothetical protein BKA70DRAFT_1562068 [Coprinopsis sp. MPI-PUGE-AT-0042]